jgi:hypothetical protein
MAFCHLSLVGENKDGKVEKISGAEVLLYLDTPDENIESSGTIVKEKGENTGVYSVVCEPGGSV